MVDQAVQTTAPHGGPGPALSRLRGAGGTSTPRGLRGSGPSSEGPPLGDFDRYLCRGDRAFGFKAWPKALLVEVIWHLWNERMLSHRPARRSGDAARSRNEGSDESRLLG